LPQIIVTADGASEQRSVMLRERVNVADFESDRFAANLVERLGWAVIDAAEAERDQGTDERQSEDTEPERRFQRKPAVDRVPQGRLAAAFGQRSHHRFVDTGPVAGGS